ncbi:hypothetical protein HDV05_006173 [Chytridiales sp. JEL 0842]|nr:hypothetical protein HDV05_006173 [Chytridiales sp. JEL 0842]
MASSHFYHHLRFFPTATRIGLMDTHRFLATHRDMLRALSTAALSREDAALAEVLEQASKMANALTVATVAPSVSPISQMAYNINPNLAASTWARFISTLKTAVSMAGKALPWAGGVALVAAASAITFHLATVKVPQWVKEHERRMARMKAREASAAANAIGLEPEDVNKLLEEVTALRAEVGVYRNAAALSTSTGLTPASPRATSLEDSMIFADPYLTAAHIKSLESANASLRDALETMTLELQRRVQQGQKMAAEIRELQERCLGADSEVEKLKEEIESLRMDREVQGRKVAVLEENLEQLRTLFSSIAASRGNSRAASPAPSTASSVSLLLEPLVPVADLSGSSIAGSEDRPPHLSMSVLSNASEKSVLSMMSMGSVQREDAEGWETVNGGTAVDSEVK